MLDWQLRARSWLADPAAIEADRHRRIRRAREIWAQARPAMGTVAASRSRSHGQSAICRRATATHGTPGRASDAPSWPLRSALPGRTADALGRKIERSSILGELGRKVEAGRGTTTPDVGGPDRQHTRRGTKEPSDLRS
jgi:hypothetical protein